MQRALLMTLVSVSLLAACTSATVGTSTPPTSLPPEAVCGPAASNVVYLQSSDLANPQSAKIQAAVKAFESHAYVVLCGSNAAAFAGDLGLQGVGVAAVDESLNTGKATPRPGAPSSLRALTSTPTPGLPSPEPTTPAQLAVVGFHLSQTDVVQAFDGFIDDAADESTALADWIKGESVASAPAGPVVGGGWQNAYGDTIAYEPPKARCPGWIPPDNDPPAIWTPCKNLSQVSYNYYRLSDINPKHDWYMVTERMTGKPEWQQDKCEPWWHFGRERNWWSNDWRLVTNYLRGSTSTLIANGPPTTESSGSVSYTIGGSLGIDVLPGVSADFSASWSQPHVTIANQSGGKIASQYIQFEPPGSTCSPVLTTISSMFSEHSAMFQVPQGESVVFDGSTALDYAAWWYGQRNSGDNSGMEVRFSPHFALATAAFAASPRSVTLTSSNLKGRIHIVAQLGPSRLSWTIKNAPSWIVLSASSGTGDADVTIEAQKDAPAGSIANLNVNTNPAASANSVETGPLIVRVEKH
jgi:hypothetical protein